MRLFLGVAVPPSPTFAKVTAELRDAVPAARPVPDGTWHATLRFLGETADEKVAAITATLLPLVARHSSIPVAVRGVGAFPSPRKARVVWAGMEAPGLDQLAAEVAAATPLQGNVDGGRAFHAHVTLARLDPPRDVQAFVRERSILPFSVGAISEVVLFRSQLTPQGPAYTPEARFSLAP